MTPTTVAVENRAGRLFSNKRIDVSTEGFFEMIGNLIERIFSGLKRFFNWIFGGKDSSSSSSSSSSSTVSVNSSSEEIKAVIEAKKEEKLETIHKEEVQQVTIKLKEEIQETKQEIKEEMTDICQDVAISLSDEIEETVKEVESELIPEVIVKEIKIETPKFKLVNGSLNYGDFLRSVEEERHKYAEEMEKLREHYRTEEVLQAEKSLKRELLPLFEKEKNSISRYFVKKYSDVALEVSNLLTKELKGAWIFGYEKGNDFFKIIFDRIEVLKMTTEKIKKSVDDFIRMAKIDDPASFRNIESVFLLSHMNLAKKNKYELSLDGRVTFTDEQRSAVEQFDRNSEKEEMLRGYTYSLLLDLPELKKVVSAISRINFNEILVTIESIESSYESFRNVDEEAFKKKLFALKRETEGTRDSDFYVEVLSYLNRYPSYLSKLVSLVKSDVKSILNTDSGLRKALLRYGKNGESYLSEMMKLSDRYHATIKEIEKMKS